MVCDSFEVDNGPGNSSNDPKTRIPNVAAEITRGSRLSLEWDEMCARYVIPLRKFKLEEKLGFATKLNKMNIHRLHAALNAIVKSIEDNKVNQYVKNG